jgi:RNA polymerase sigma-70 factor (sigma-E family)
VHRPRLVKLAAFIVGDQATGEDVVQDVFTRLHQRWDMLADPGDPLPYLRTAVVNGCRSAIRRRGRAQRHAGHDSPSPPLSTEESVLLSEDRQQVLAALAGLSRRRREVLVLRFYLGLSEAEIAATLGISAGTVKSTAARGLAALARALRLSLGTGQPSGILYRSAPSIGSYEGLVPVLSADGQAQHWLLWNDPEQFGWTSGGKLVPLPKAPAGVLAIGW